MRRNEFQARERGLCSSQTLNCISSAGNQLFTEELRSIPVRSDPSGGFLGLFGDNEGFVLSPLFNLFGSNTGVIERGGVHSKAGVILFLLLDKE